MRHRTKYSVYGSLLVILIFVLADPDTGLIRNLPIGGSTVATIIFLLKGVLAATLLNVTRKFMHDYDSADFEKLGIIAQRSSEGAGKHSIAVSLMTIAYAIVIFGAFLS